MGKQGKRPDIVLYVNGIALGVLELKRSKVSLGDGIRQSIANQQKEFIQAFFAEKEKKNKVRHRKKKKRIRSDTDIIYCK